jgi:transcriptional regulator with XRE-family HTH domain
MYFRIKELAQERGMTADDLARRSGIKFGTVRNLWQNRTKDPSFSTISAIAKALEVPMESLVESLSASARPERGEPVNNSSPLQLAA